MSDNTDVDAGAGAGTPIEQPRIEGGNEPRGTGTDPNAGKPQEPSANKLIKDFAQQRGMTVEQLFYRLQKDEDANKSELQRALDRVKELDGQYSQTAKDLQQERAEKAIRDAAAQSGARADRLAGIYRLVRDDVQYDANGKPTNVAALIEQAQNDAPEFFQRVAGSGDGGKGTGTDNGSDPHAAMNRALRQSAGYSG